nr:MULTISPECIES: pyocin activator PrtN family protein [unclassified Pseudomonas]
MSAKSQKAALGVHLSDLAMYIDIHRTRAEADHKKYRPMTKVGAENNIPAPNSN